MDAMSWKKVIANLVFVLALVSPVVYCDMSEGNRLEIPLNKQKKVVELSVGAEVLHSTAKYKVDENGFWTQQIYHSIQIGDQQAARDYGRIVFRYNDFYQEGKLEFANVLNRQGKIKPVKEDAVQHRDVNSMQDFY